MRLRTLALVFLFVLFYSVSSQTYFEDVIKQITNMTSNNNELETARKKKKGGKYLNYLLWGSLLVKSIIFPLAFKAMAVMTSIAVLLSAMGLIISSIVGYAKLGKPSPVKVVHKLPYNHWAKDDTGIKNYYGSNGENYEFFTPGPQ